MKERFTKRQRSIIAVFLTLTMMIGLMYGNVIVEAAKKQSLYIKTTKYTRTKETKKNKKIQTIRVKNLSSNEKVSWKSSNKKLATVKAGKSGKAKLTVSLGKVGKAKITATVKNKKNNKKIRKLSKIITVVNKTAVETTSPSETPTTQPTETPVTTPTTEPTETQKPTEVPIPDVEAEWVGTWGTSVYEAEANDVVNVSNATLRQIIRISTGGDEFRIHLTNQYGKSPLKINSVHIAKPVDNSKGIVNPGTIDISTDTKVTFNDGDEAVEIPAGGTIISDSIQYYAESLEKMSISIAFESAPTASQMTSHGGGRHYSFFGEGNVVSQETLSIAKNVNNADTKSWLFIDKVDVLSSTDSKAIACFGDSITDGYGTDAGYSPYNQEPGQHTRWTDILAQNLQGNPLTENLSVINLGIGGVSATGTYRAGAIRFERDVLKDDIGYFVFLIGVNDIGEKTSDDGTAEKVIAKYEEWTEKCHASGIKVYGCTLMPFGNNNYYTVYSEAMRQKLNTWIRESAESGKIDGMIDFDEKMKDSAKEPSQMLVTYDGDGLHPGIKGYKFMGDLVFAKFLTGVQ